jgi:hypothetical protein
MRVGFEARSDELGREQRKTVRREARYAVAILHGEGPVKVACTLLDISEAGARLMLPGDTTVPDEFVLLLSANGRARRRCRVAWRGKRDQIGVQFVSSE